MVPLLRLCFVILIIGLISASLNPGKGNDCEWSIGKYDIQLKLLSAS